MLATQDNWQLSLVRLEFWEGAVELLRPSYDGVLLGDEFRMVNVYEDGVAAAIWVSCEALPW